MDLHNAKRDEIATDLRTRAPEGLREYMRTNAFARQSDMSKDDWIDAHECVLGGKLQIHTSGADPETETETETPAPVAETETPEPAPAKALDLGQSLDALSVVLSEKALAPIRQGIAALEREAEQERVRAKQAELTARNAQARAAAVPTPTAPGTQAPAHVANVVCEKPLRDVIKGSRSDAPVTVCDYPDAPAIDPGFKWPREALTAFTAMAVGHNVMIFGDRGTGKSTLIAQIAAVTHRPYFQISFDAETSSAELFGFQGVDGDGMAWVPGDLLIAMQTPNAIVDLSEISMARPDLISKLFPMLERSDRTLFVGGVTHRVAPGVQFFATSNDNGSGENSARFHGTRPLNPALVSRFGVRIELQLPDRARLSSQLASRTGAPRAACDLLAKFEKDMESGGVKPGNCETTPGQRALVAWLEMTRAGVSSRDAFEVCVLNSASAVDSAYWQQEASANFDHSKFTAALAAPSGTGEPAPDTEGPAVEPLTRSGFTEI